MDKKYNIRNIDNRGVSPVIGVILMVAITVILAAVIGAFVLGFAGNLSDTPPTAQFSYDYDDGEGEIEITHEGGEFINTNQLEITRNGNPTDNQFSDTYDTIETGDSLVLDESGIATGDEIRIIWEASSGDRSQTLSEFTLN